MRDERRHRESGSVMVMVAIWLPLLALFTSFAIDVSHFFDYSRNLQNRADAAALAAGGAYGGTCFGTGYTQAQTDVIGETAQQYSGPPNGTPDANLPYAYNSATPYENQPNLTKGTPTNYHVLLNSTSNWPAGTDWSMGSDAAHQGSSLALCSSTDENGNTGAMTDVRVTQSNLGLFFPLLSLQPTISAHARVTLEAVGGENNITPVAVRDPAATKCVEAQFFNAATNTQIGADVPLTRKGIDPNTGAIQWDNSSAPASVAIPSGANVYVEIVTDYCTPNPTTYDSGSGLLYINSWSTTAPASGAPWITTGGVTLTGPCPADSLSNQYFTNEPCTVGLSANVAFATGAGATTVSATDTNTNTTIQLVKSTDPTTPNLWTTPSDQGFTIAPGSGQHLFTIQTTQSSGNPCNGRGKNVGVCDLGVQTQGFGACNDTDLTCNNPPDDSGPMVLAQLRLASDSAGQWASDPTQTYGENAFAGDPTNPQSMVVTVEIAGLRQAQPGDPPTILRFSENAKNANHATGLIDCGQGQSATGGLAAIIQGCPTVGTSACAQNEFYSCAPLARNMRPVTDPNPCDPEGNALTGTVVARTTANPMVAVDCTGTAAGNMPPVVQGIACHVLVDGCDAKGNLLGSTQCSANNWDPGEGASSIPAGDPRALTMVITTPTDLAANNSGQIIPIQDFATFYVTGWTTQGNNPSCGSYAAPTTKAANPEKYNNCPDGTIPPNGQCAGTSKGMVWGYWMKYTDVGGIPSGEACKPSTLGNCVPALTR